MKTESKKGPKIVNLSHSIERKNGTKNGNMSHSNIDSGTMLNLKLLFFFYYASVSCINPFLSVYYNSLGMTSETIGILSALSPFINLIVTPIWGVLADRSGSKIDVLLVAVTSATLLRTCLLLPGTKYVWFLTLIVFLKSVFYAPVKSLNDSVVLSFLPKGNKSIYGKIREWGPAGKFISSPLMAYFIGNSKNGFQIAFITSALLSLPVILCHFNLRLKDANQTDKPKDEKKKISLLKSFQILKGNRPLMRFFGLLFIFGASFGFVEAFVYVHIKKIFLNLNISSNWTVSICRMCMAGGGVFGFRISAWLMQRYQTNGTIVISMMAQALSCFLYALSEKQDYLISIQMLLFLAEIIRAASFSVLWSVSTIHVNMLSDPEMSSSALAFMDAVYTGLGKTFGCSFGGKVISQVGGIGPTLSYVGYILLTTSSILILKGDEKTRKKVMKKIA